MVTRFSTALAPHRAEAEALPGQTFADAWSVSIARPGPVPVAKNDAFVTDEATAVSGSLFADNGSGPDTDASNPLAVTTVNGNAANVGVEIMLASGALLTVNADGSFTYKPNHAFDETPAAASGASNATAHDSFDYQLADGSQATATISINGLDSDDVLYGTAGDDNLFGGIGDDIFHVNNPGDYTHESQGEGFDTVIVENDFFPLQAGQYIERIEYFDPSATLGVRLWGNQTAQTIIGSAGDDEIRSQAPGNHVLIGLAGDDGYEIENAGDLVVEDSGEGFDTVYVHWAAGSYALAPGTEVEHLAAWFPDATEALNLTGNELAQRIDGSAGNNTIIGGGGGDVLAGGLGRDTYRVVDLSEVIIESLSNPASQLDAIYVAMALGSYTLAADLGVETLGAIDPQSTVLFNLTGNGLSNTLFGSAGRNTLIGGGAADSLVGFGGDDFYRVEDVGDQVLEAAGQGFDAVYAGTSYTLATGQEVELLAAIDPGSTAAMNLTGNGAANELYGNAGANILDGKDGTDILYGGAGADRFTFTTNYNTYDIDKILDFVSGTDKIALEDSVFGGIGQQSLDPAAFVAGTAPQDAGDRIIYDQATGNLYYDADGTGAALTYLFANVAGNPALTPSDFVVI